MYILLKNTDDLNDKGFYIKADNYDRETEKILIELYYRGIAEGLVECFEEEKTVMDLTVVDMGSWLEDKKSKAVRKKEKLLVSNLSDKIKSKI